MSAVRLELRRGVCHTVTPLIARIDESSLKGLRVSRGLTRSQSQSGMRSPQTIADFRSLGPFSFLGSVVHHFLSEANCRLRPRRLRPRRLEEVVVLGDAGSRNPVINMREFLAA